MKVKRNDCKGFLLLKAIGILAAAMLLVLPAEVLAAKGGVKGPNDKGGKPGAEKSGNNLSYPVIWAEGVTKALPGEPEMIPVTTGEWMYWWGTEGEDPDIVPLSCKPFEDDATKCAPDATHTEAYDPGGEGYEDALVRAYLQKDPGNVWQAGVLDWSSVTPIEPLNVDLIDWSDSLESVDWYTRSQVRAEVVLFQKLDLLDSEYDAASLTEYGMRHVSGWGIDEVHGIATKGGNSTSVEIVEYPDALPERVFPQEPAATVYSTCARLSIQKLLVAREDPNLNCLKWSPPGQNYGDDAGWVVDYESCPAVTSELINAPIFSDAVWEGGDGPEYYSAEINVKGRIIYGYTWNVRKLNDPTPVPPETLPSAVGDYRITFSFDEQCETNVFLNTFFTDGVTQILVPDEEDIALAVALAEKDAAESETEGAGAVAVLDTVDNLTFMDVRILERSGGKGGGKP